MRQMCLNMVYELAKKDERVFFIGSDLGVGTLDQFKKEMPDRFFMEGVSEANMIGMATGLALEGKITYDIDQSDLTHRNEEIGPFIKL